MFYSQEILQRRTGRFGIIWIAATKGSQISKKEYAAVNIRETCENLLAYIMAQAQPLRPGGQRPRFSLYLSSQLMYGIVRVYERQQSYLFSDAASLSVKCHTIQATVTEIDLSKYRSDHMTIVDEIERVRRVGTVYPEDPWFGQLKSVETIDWRQFPDVQDVRIQPTPNMDLSPNLSNQDIDMKKTPKHHFTPVLGSPHQVQRPEDITLVEDPMANAENLPLYGEQDLPPLGDEEFNELNVPDEQRSKESILFSDNDKLTLYDDPMDLGEYLDRGQLPVINETPMNLPEFTMTEYPGEQSALVVPPLLAGKRERGHLRRKFEMELDADVDAAALAHRRRRQLQFYDTELQIPREHIRRQLQDGQQTCQAFHLCGKPFPSAKELLNQPSRKELQDSRLTHLWKRNAISRDFRETDSERCHPVWTLPDLVLSDSFSNDGSIHGDLPLNIGEPPLSPVLEVPEEDRQRDISSDSALEFPREGASHLSLDVSAKDLSNLSHSRSATSSIIRDAEPGASRSRRRSSSVDRDKTLIEKTLTEDLGTLQEVAEEQLSPVHDESPRKRRRTETDYDLAERMRSPGHHRLLSRLTSQTANNMMTTFEDVCPHSSSRHWAARMFLALLNFAAVKKVSVNQEEPYGTIFIQRGTNWRNN